LQKRLLITSQPYPSAEKYYKSCRLANTVCAYPLSASGRLLTDDNEQVKRSIPFCHLLLHRSHAEQVTNEGIPLTGSKLPPSR